MVTASATATRVPGCTDETACNYSADATDDDASCTYADLGLNCDGSCIDDTDGDGICDGDESPRLHR